LITDQARNATVTAETAVNTLRITRADFQRLNLHTKLVFPKRAAVGGGRNILAGKDKKNVQSKPTEPKTSEEQTLLVEALKNNKNLSTTMCMDSEITTQLADSATKRQIAKGVEVITEGSMDADFFYIVSSGSFEVVLPKNTSMEAQVTASAIIIERGGSFGELALLYPSPRAATVISKEESVVWCISRDDFKCITAKGGNAVVNSYITHLNQVGTMSGLTPQEKEAVASALVEMAYTKDEMIIEQGEVGNTFYMMIAGEVQVIKDGIEQIRLTSTSGKVQTFGERALLNDEPRAASVKVVSATAKVLMMDRESYNLLLNGGKDAKGGSAVASNSTRIKRSDLNILGLLGCGGFGAVKLAEVKSSGEVYALKSVSKGFVMQQEMAVCLVQEKDIQLMCDCPFIIKLMETYEEANYLHFLLEMAQGGDLFVTYSRKGFHGSEAHALFYVAGVVMAFDYLHKKKIIYRDLKPENLLLTNAGFVKLTDMGLAKVCVSRTFTTCGTPDYFAPEVIASKGYQHSVDWWTCGILIFELLAGTAPFTAADPMKIFEKVTKGIATVSFPTKIKDKPKSLITGLLQKDPSLRLAVKKGGTKNIKGHAWYAGFNWDQFAKGSVKPPYIPDVRGAKDLSNFVAMPKDMPPEVPYKDDGSGCFKNFATST